VLDHWDRGARAILRDELSAELRELTTQLLKFTGDIKSSHKRIERWLEQKRSAVAHYQSIIADLKSSSTIDLAMLSVAVRQVRSLAREHE
jgi:glutamate dehydrogenase